MKFFLKSVVLLALIVGGKLSKAPRNTVLAATPVTAARPILTSQRRPTPPPPRNPVQQPEPVHSQVLSVFFK